MKVKTHNNFWQQFLITMKKRIMFAEKFQFVESLLWPDLNTFRALNVFVFYTSKCLASSPHPHPKSLTKIHTRIFLCIFLCNFPCIFVCIFLWWLHRDDDGVDYTMNSNLHCTAEQYSLSELSTTHTNMYTLPPILKVL